MSQALTQSVLGVLLFVLAVVLALFLDTWYSRRSSRSQGWERINEGVVFVLLLAIGTTIAQMFLKGRTEAQCQILHRTAATFFHTSEAFVRIVFLARLLEINKMSRPWERMLDRCVLGAGFLEWMLAVILQNLTMDTAVVDDMCTAILSPAATVLMFLLPQLVDVVTNVRLYQVLMATESRHAHMFLIRMTFGFCLASSVISVLSLLIIMQIIPLPVRFYTIWLTFQQDFDACSVALPNIIVRFAHRSRAVHPSPYANTSDQYATATADKS
ncbi:THH1/TOM1/TOM3 domain-containing protein [Plasmodiophora brassicae]